jgi:hypothetical protein
MARIPAALLLALTAVAACGGPDARRTAFTRDLVRLETEAATGRHGEALVRSQALLDVAIGTRETCPVLVSRARALAGMGRAAEALATWDRIAADCTDVPLESSVAMLHLARWMSETGRDGLDAIPVLESLVQAFPDEPAARRAIPWLREELARALGAVAAAGHLEALAARIRPGGAAAANLLFEAGDLLRGLGGDDDTRPRALALFDRVIDEHPHHGLANDALMARAELLRALGRPREAVASLESLLGRREWSFLIGSYEIDLYRQASGMLPEFARAAGETDAQVARREREHRRRYPPPR